MQICTRPWKLPEALIGCGSRWPIRKTINWSPGDLFPQSGKAISTPPTKKTPGPIARGLQPRICNTNQGNRGRNLFTVASTYAPPLPFSSASPEETVLAPFPPQRLWDHRQIRCPDQPAQKTRLLHIQEAMTCQLLPLRVFVEVCRLQFGCLPAREFRVHQEGALRKVDLPGR